MDPLFVCSTSQQYLFTHQNNTDLLRSDRNSDEIYEIDYNLSLFYDILLIEWNQLLIGLKRTYVYLYTIQSQFNSILFS